MATCYQKHPFEIENEDRLTTINTKIFEIKKKIQLSEGQRKSHYEENEAQKKQNNDLIDTLKKEIKIRLNELAQVRAVLGEEEIQIKRYLNEICPIGKKNFEQILHNLDLKVIEQRKSLDLLKYEMRSKKNKLKELEREYEKLLIENTKATTMKSKLSSSARKRASHLENEIHRVLVQWTEAELVKKKYCSIRQALLEDSVKFESSLMRIDDLLIKQREEIKKLEYVREEAAEMRMRASIATTAEAARAHDAEHGRTMERAYFAQRFDDRKRELEKLEKRIFPPPVRTVVRQESTGSTEGAATTEEATAIVQMEEIFQKLMKLTGVTDPEEVFDRFRNQRETSKRLNYLQQTTEDEKLDLEKRQTTLMAELEAFKFASVKDKDEAQDQMLDLKEQINKEEEDRDKLESRLDGLNTFLMEMKKLLYDMCKMLDIIAEPPMPEWTAEARDVQQIITTLTTRYEKVRTRVDDVRERRKDCTTFVMPSNPTSGAPSVAGISVQSHSTQKDVEAVPTYKEMLQKEPVRPPPSDDEEDIPSRCYLKRQAQVIIDTKCRRKGIRGHFPRR